MSDGPAKCRTCRFWDSYGYGGYCHRHAPTMNHQHNASWPSTSETQWCGDHEAKPDTTPPSSKIRN